MMQSKTAERGDILYLCAPTTMGDWVQLKSWRLNWGPALDRLLLTAQLKRQGEMAMPSPPMDRTWRSMGSGVSERSNKPALLYLAQGIVLGSNEMNYEHCVTVEDTYTQ